MTGFRLSEIPNWVPSAVCLEATRIYEELVQQAGPASDFSLLNRLIGDQTMKAVWKELFKKNRITGEFFHKSDIPGMEIFERPALLQQELNVRYFFAQAFYFAQQTPLTLASEIIETQGSLWAEGSILREQAEKFRMRGMVIEATELERIASVCDEEGDGLGPDPGDPGVVFRDRGEPLVRAYVTSLADVSRQVFGNPLYSTLARVTNVALERSDVTASAVRGMVRA